MNERLENGASRKFGLDFVGEVPWGTHFCQFYETKADLIDILVPYFAEGLRNNEFCIWITSEPLGVEEAKAALEKVVPNLDEYFKKGQIEILPHDEWYLKRGRFSADRVLKGWVQKKKNALEKGFDGLRLTGNTFWVERKHWKSFTDYEGTVNDVISSYRMIALCTYCLERCSGNDIVDVMRNHVGTLIRKGEHWSLVEDRTQRMKAEESLRESERFLRRLADLNPAVISISDLVNGREIYSSKDALGLLGYKRDEIQDMDSFAKSIIFPSDYERMIAAAEELKKSSENRARNIEVRLKHADGQWRWFLITYVVFKRNVDGQPLQTMSLSRDITDYKKAEEEIVSIAKFPSENPFPVLRVAKNGNVLFSNVAGFDLLKEWKCEIGQPVPELWRDALVEVLRSGASKELEANIGDKVFSCILVPVAASDYVNVYGRDMTEHKRAEQLLRESEEKYRNIVETAEEGVLISTPDGKILFVNQKMAEMLGYSREEIVGRGGLEFMDEGQEALVLHLRKELKEGKMVNRELRFRRKDGTSLWTICSASRLVNGAGQYISNLAMHTDITERKKAEDALLKARDELEMRVEERTKELQAEITERRKAEEALRKTRDELEIRVQERTKELRENQFDLNRAQAVARTGSWRLNVQRNELIWSDETYRMFGIPKGTPLTYEAFLEAVHPDDKGYVDEKWKAALHGGVYDIEHRIVVNGEVRWVREKAELDFDKDGVLTGGFGTVQDITERKQTEQALNQAKRDWERTFDSVPDLITVVDNQHRILRANQAMAKQLGTTPENCIGLFCFDCVHGASQPPEFCPHAQTLRDGQEHIAEIHEDRLGGDFLVSTTPLRDEQGQMVGSVHVARNVTEFKRAEEKILAEKQFSDMLINSLPGVFYAINTDAQFLQVNNEFARVIGHSTEEMLKMHAMDLFAEEEKKLIEERIREVFEKGVSTAEAHLQSKDGRAIPYYFTGVRIEKDGKPILIGMGFDITERKTAEQKIRESERIQTEIRERRQAEEKLRAASLYTRSLIEASLDPLVTISAEGKITDVNKATEEATGLSREELIGSDFSNYFTEPEKAREGYRQVFEKGFVLDYPLAMRHKSGKIADVLYNATVYKNEAGEIQGVFAAARDVTERKQAEEKSRTASLYARSLIEASLDPLVTISAEGKITDVNKATEEATGLSREELIGSDFSNYFTEPEKAREGYRQVFEKGYVKDYPLAIRHKSGKITDVLYHATVYRNEAGEIQGVFAAARDVTEHKLSEEKLRAASLYARSLIEASLDPLVTISAEGKITDVNKTTEEATGLSREQLIGSDFSNYFTDPEKARAGYQQVFTQGFVRDYPLAIRHQSGKITEVLYNATVFRNEKGEIQGVFAAARDVTERKQAEDRIKEQAELLDKASDAITVRDLDNHILYWNKGAQQMYGWTAEEIVGKKANEVLYKEEAPQSVEARKDVIEKGEWVGELNQVTKDGRQIVVQTRYTLMRDNEGNPRSILAINTDVTDKKNLETQMLRAQRMESVGTLASGMAHDLNNVLTPIMLSLQLLQTEIKDEENKKTLDLLEKSAHRGADLVKQVLTFARGVVGERKPIKVTHLIGEIEKIIKETFPKSVEIRTTVPTDLWTVSGDATQLHQVIMNLCLNARDAMPEGGTLSISADNVYVDEAYSRMHIDAKIGNYVAITVSDNGVGIAPELRDKIFIPFVTTKERGKGTGLGLSTSLAIVKSHGGFINFYSEVRKGSTFKVYLPIIAGEAEKIEVVASGHFGGKGELILVVEDEVSICEITRAILESNGYRAIIANDGAEAVAVYSKNKEDVKAVLMDMAMPVMDGYMSIHALHRIDPAIKIIAVSGLTENGRVATLVDTVKAFLAKPYTSERLLKTIDEVLRSK